MTTKRLAALVALIAWITLVRPVPSLGEPGPGPNLCPAPLARIGDGHGTLILVGGAMAVDNVALFEAIKRYLDRGAGRFSDGARRARVAVLATSKRTLAEARSVFYDDDPDDPSGSPSYRSWFRSRGFDPVFIPVALDVATGSERASERAENVMLVRSCQVVFFTGGDQARHARSLLLEDGRDSAVLAAVREVYAAGGVVMGTSAGTHVLADPMYGWGESYETMLHGKLQAVSIADVPTSTALEPETPGNSIRLPGFGFLPRRFLTDTHFDARGRLGRLLVGMRDTGSAVAVGVDENTALFVEEGLGTVVGQRSVFFVEWTSAPSTQGELFSAKGVEVSVLTDGDTVTLAGPAVITPSKPPVTPHAASLRPSSDLFAAARDAHGGRRNPYEATRVLREFVDRGADQVWSSTHELSPRFDVRFFRSDRTRGFRSGSAVTVVRVGMDVAATQPARGRGAATSSPPGRPSRSDEPE